MNTLFKKCEIVLFFFSLFLPLKGQIFSLVDSFPTNISNVVYTFIPVQSSTNAFNLLFYSSENKKQNFELLILKDTSISKMEIKNKGLDGGGSWYQSAFISDKELLLLHVDGFLVVYKKNKKENFVFKETLNIKGRNFNKISMLDAENVLLMNTYNFYNEKKLYDDYVLCVLNLWTKKVVYQKNIDLGKGILLSHYSSTSTIESKKDKIAIAHPTLPFIYIYNDKLNSIDTIYVQFHDTISVDSVINAVFTDSMLELNKTNPKEIIQIIENKKIDQMERIEKVFWLSDDILGYTIRQAFSRERLFVFYSVSEKRELYKKLSDEQPYNFNSSKRVLINNNKTIWYGLIFTDDERDIYYKFYVYDLLPFIY